MEEAMQEYTHDDFNEMEEDAELEHIESVILVALRMRNNSIGHVVDMTQLQADCYSIGFDSREFSAGFVRLLMRRFLQPYGDFAFSLSEIGHKAGEKVLLSRIRQPYQGKTEFFRTV